MRIEKAWCRMGARYLASRIPYLVSAFETLFGLGLTKLKTLIKTASATFSNKETIAATVIAFVAALAISSILSTIALDHHTAGTIQILNFTASFGMICQDVSDSCSLILCAFSIIFIILSIVAKKLYTRYSSIFFTLLLLLASITIFISFMKPAINRQHYFDAGDMYNYLLTPKYIQELGLEDNYNCTLLAMKEMGMSLPKHTRDLSSNKHVSVNKMLSAAKQKEYRSQFSDARWNEFKKDIKIYRNWFSKRGWSHRFTDHGYNGTPLRSFFMYHLANVVNSNETDLTLVSFINILMVSVMFILIIKIFGWQIGLLFSIFFCINFPDRFILAGSLVRYWWLLSLLSGICCLKTNRHGLAGFFIAFSAMFQVFPLLFLVGLSLKYCILLLSGKPAPLRLHKFMIIVFFTTISLFALSLSTGRGLNNWTEFKHQMDLNSGRMATGRIGYIYNFMYPKEVSQAQQQGRYEEKKVSYEQSKLAGVSLQHIKLITTALFIIFMISLMNKTNDVEFTILLGFSLFFLLFSTVRYYYAGLLGFPLLFYRETNKLSGKLFILTLFLVMFTCYSLQAHTIYSFNYNTILSTSFTLLIVFSITYFHLTRKAETPLLKPKGEKGSAPKILIQE